MDVTDDRVSIIDVTDGEAFARVPPCADPGFDHRSCDYWEDADRGSKAARLDWLRADEPLSTSTPPPALSTPPANPFLADLAAARPPAATNPFLAGDDD